MLFGPMKPVGLEDPKTGKRPYAVIQLRQDDAAGTLYNIVGFQTHLRFLFLCGHASRFLPPKLFYINLNIVSLLKAFD